MKPKGLFLSIRLKLFIAFTLLITLVLGVAFFWLYNLFTDMATRTLRSEVTDILNADADSLNGDHIASLIATPQIDDSKNWPDNITDDRYWEVADWFDQIAAINPRAYPFVYYKDADGQVTVLVDSVAVEDPTDPDGYQFGDQLQFDPQDGAFLLDGLEERTLDVDLYQDRSGVWVSGAEPIKDSSGKIVAALAVDVAANSVVENQLNLRSALLPIFGGTYLLLFLTAWLITAGMTRSIRALDKASRECAEGRYQVAEVRSGFMYDEIVRFGLTFNQMIEKVHGREEKLRNQVQKLTIEIDEARRKKAVKDVTDSDFFRDLRSKASDMRQRHREDGDQA